MRRTDALGRALLGAIGVLLLIMPTAEGWRAASSPYPLVVETVSSAGTECNPSGCWEKFTPIGILALAWFALAGGLAIFAAVSGRGAWAVPASVLAGLAWVLPIVDDLRVRSLHRTEGMWGALWNDPGMLETTARLAMMAAILALLMLVGSIAMRRATPSS